VAFVQGGADADHEPDSNPDADLRSLGSMFYEPVWLFYREDSAKRLLKADRLSSLAQLPGWKVNIGTAGSGVPMVMRRLLEANMQQSDAPLAEVLGLLSTLSEAWAGIRKAQDAPLPESPWSQPVAQEAGRGLQGWSL